MRLKRLELYGYKSFAARCSFAFGEGVTAIVGPNGSGKSNIADAVRWVMGEQSYGVLRAKSTEDMIFSGSRARPRLGMAEVVMTLDNADGWLPLEYTEVTLGRRAYRSGENEYFVNSNRMRYRDVLDILGSAGLMRTTYTVIGQGLVDEALALRPEARRPLFEEAAGVAPQLRKRAEALRRIDETQRNLERVSDILNELRPTAAHLRRQAERAEEHQLLQQDLRELQRIWYGYHWHHRQRQLVRTEQQLRDHEAQLVLLREHHSAMREEIEHLAAQQVAARRHLDRLQGEVADYREKVELLRRELALAAERRRLYQQQQGAAETELRTMAQRSQVLRDEVQRVEQELAEQERSSVDGHAELDAARAELAKAQTSRRDVDRRAAALRHKQGELASVLAAYRAQLGQLDERSSALQTSLHDIAGGLARSAERATACQEEGAALAKRERALAEEEARAQQEAAQMEAELVTCREEVAQGSEVVAQARAEWERLSSRLDLLTRVRQDLTGYYPGVREVLAPDRGLRGLLGTVASLMQVPRDLEQAIEAALGQRLQHVIAERWEDAEEAIAHLKRCRAGWASFIPLDTLRSRPAVAPPASEGVVGVASALVGFAERLRPAYEFLLGTVVVVADLPTARRLLSRRTGASLLVTLGGETVQPSGVLSGGARREAAHLLEQEREWRELPAASDAARQSYAAAEQARRDHAERLAALQLRYKEAAGKAKTASVQRELERRAVTASAQQLEDLQREERWLVSRQDEMKAELGRMALAQQTLSRKQADAEGAEVALAVEGQSVQRELDQAEMEGPRRRVAELETRAAVSQRTLHSLRTLLASHRANLGQLAAQEAAKRADVKHLHDEVARQVQMVQALTADLADLEGRMSDGQQALLPAREEIARLDRAMSAVEHKRQKSQERVSEAERERDRVALEHGRLRDEQGALSREIETSLGPISLPDDLSHQLRLDLGDEVVVLPALDSIPAKLGEEIAEMKARIRRLGMVNPSAPQEYQQLLERQTFLQGQTEDLRGAIAGLHEVIHELDRVIERDLAATISRVDREFRECFARLFGGGSGRLELTDPVNIATTGVEIIAQPPGKRGQSLALLSGGERALTAAALIFALLRAHPVPFCFLDEVDAALDEANVGRFRDLLREQASSTQFVLITHNRGTVEVASAIYGIAMGEQGVSQPYSLRLDPTGEPPRG